MWRGKLVLACVLAMVTLLSISVPAKAAAAGTAGSFTFVSINVPCGACPRGVALQTIANGINPAGQIVGAYLDALGHQHGFLFSHERFTTIDFPGAMSTNARGIGPGGDIVGSYVVAPGTSLSDIKGFMYSHGTFSTVLFTGHPGAIPQRITPDGTIYGCFHDNDFTASMFGTAWSRFGNTSLATGGGELTDPAASVPASMNTGATPDGHTIVGLYANPATATGHGHGYILRNGGFQSYDVPGSGRTAIWDVNASGDFVGLYRDSSGTHGFLQLSDGSAPISINYPGATATIAFGINAGGAVVGQYTDASGMTHGFLAMQEGQE